LDGNLLYSFMSQNGDGAYPNAGLAIGADGTLFGTTTAGGDSNYGAVFALTPPSSPGGDWTETLLHHFTAQPSDGANPYTGLVVGANGSLLGTTASGGTSNYGTVFALTPPATAAGLWTETVLYSFSGQYGQSAFPSALVIGPDGSLYGTTASGGMTGLGTAYKLTPPATTGDVWSETVLAGFFGVFEGANPQGGLVFGPGGNLYGTTELGGNVGGNPQCQGSTFGCGTVFELKP